MLISKFLWRIIPSGACLIVFLISLIASLPLAAQSNCQEESDFYRSQFAGVSNCISRGDINEQCRKKVLRLNDAVAMYGDCITELKFPETASQWTALSNMKINAGQKERQFQGLLEQNEKLLEKIREEMSQSNISFSEALERVAQSQGISRQADYLPPLVASNFGIISLSIALIASWACFAVGRRAKGRIGTALLTSPLIILIPWALGLVAIVSGASVWPDRDVLSMASRDMSGFLSYAVETSVELVVFAVPASFVLMIFGFFKSRLKCPKCGTIAPHGTPVCENCEFDFLRGGAR